MNYDCNDSPNDNLILSAGNHVPSFGKIDKTHQIPGDIFTAKTQITKIVSISKVTTTNNKDDLYLL